MKPKLPGRRGQYAVRAGNVCWFDFDICGWLCTGRDAYVGQRFAQGSRRDLVSFAAAEMCRPAIQQPLGNRQLGSQIGPLYRAPVHFPQNGIDKTRR